MFFLHSEKEKRDVTEFDIASYMAKNQIAVMTAEDKIEARKIEEQEYIEAKNKQDVAEKEVNIVFKVPSCTYNPFSKVC